VLTWNLFLTNSRLPVMLQQPRDRIVAAGATAIFSVVAVNVPPITAPLTYRWLFNGSEINGGTNSSLTVSNVGEANLGYYIVEISNDAESVLSEHVVLQINISEGNTVNELISTEDKFANLLNAITISPLQTASVNPRGVRLSGGGLARGFTGTQIFSTVGSTSEAGEPNHCGVAGGASQWFVYQAEVDGRLSVSTEGSDFDTVLAVYTGPGDSFLTLREVACDNDSGTNGKTSIVNIPATAGTIYFIAVDGVRGATGNARLNYNLIGPSRVRAELTKTGQFLVQVSGQPLRNYTVEASTNFLQWVPLLSTNASAGTIEFKDLSAPSFQQRFYRAVASP